MIILDTNVLSELIKPSVDQRVVAWLDSQAVADLAVTAITKAEMLAGAAALDAGRRRRRLLGLIEAVLAPFEASTLAFDSRSAVHFADIIAVRKRIGRPMGHIDAQIASIALQHGAAVATRDIADFDKIDLELINPWVA